ncbi:hypothetical protein [uncultured Phyllobacterium sp.]|uniref:hypothetical protein n=1 Tax=uncultured Phyllobacterium sp. TaxID=253813 RepID=UPI00258B7D3A|nr:hypothetical protein [uncultured Phyllobacterium sp.]
MKNELLHTNQHSVDSIVSIEPSSIFWGSIVLQIRIDNEVITTVFDDFRDKLSNFVKFANDSISGRFPSAAITQYGTTTWTIEAVAEPGMCRFTAALRGTSEWSNQPVALSIIIDRKCLNEQLIGLSRTIGNHYNLAHGFLFFGGGFGHSVMKDLLEQAKNDWNVGIADGTFTDNSDQKDEYLARRMVLELPLSSAQ